MIASLELRHDLVHLRCITIMLPTKYQGNTTLNLRRLYESVWPDLYADRYWTGQLTSLRAPRTVEELVVETQVHAHGTDAITIVIWRHRSHYTRELLLHDARRRISDAKTLCKIGGLGLLAADCRGIVGGGAEGQRKLNRASALWLCGLRRKRHVGNGRATKVRHPDGPSHVASLA